MPLVNLKSCIENADLNKYALGCFNIINVESLEGIIKAAEIKNSPVCITFHPPHFRYTDIEILASAVRIAASKSHIPVILHLDNAENLSQIISAVKYGFTSLMYVGNPEMDFEEKVKQTKKVSDVAHGSGLLLESDIIRNKDKNYIDSVIEFSQRTGIDIISVDIVRKNNKDGTSKVVIDLELLKSIKTSTKKFISLHGGSAVPDEMIKKAISLGLNKMHIYGRSAENAILKIQEDLKSGQRDIIELIDKQRIGFREVVERSIDIFGSRGMADIFTGEDSNVKFNNEILIDSITKAVIKKLRL